MRKLLKFLFMPMAVVMVNVFCCFGNAGTRVDDDEENDIETADRIRIEIIKETKKVPRTRSEIQVVDMFYCPSVGEVELFFNVNVGEVVISAYSPSGCDLVSCDTEDTFFVTLPVGSAPGLYRIEIVGLDYEGTGVFYI